MSVTQTWFGAWAVEVSLNEIVVHPRPEDLAAAATALSDGG